MIETKLGLNHRDEAIRRLADAYSSDFAEFVAGNDLFHELLQDLADDFINENIPITDEEGHLDLAMEMILRVTTRSV